VVRSGPSRIACPRIANYEILPTEEPLPTAGPLLSLRDALRGRYDVQRELGRGGMGIVYLAHEVALDRPVALKLLPPELAADAEWRERFVREAKTAARLSHPNILPVFAVHYATYAPKRSSSTWRLNAWWAIARFKRRFPPGRVSRNTESRTRHQSRALRVDARLTGRS
jgi:hypothetical protein